jgi:hypothetical protein
MTTSAFGTTAKQKIAIAVDGSYLFKICAANSALARNACQKGARFPFSFPRFEKACLEDLARRGFGECEVVARYFVTSLFHIPIEALLWDGASGLVIGQNQRNHFAEAAHRSGYETKVFRPFLNARVMENVLKKTYTEKRVDSSLAVRVAVLAHDPDLVQVVLTGDGDIEPALDILPSNRYLLASGKPGQGSPSEWVYRNLFVLEHHAREIMGESSSISCFHCQRSRDHLQNIAEESTDPCRYCDILKAPTIGQKNSPQYHRFFSTGRVQEKHSPSSFNAFQSPPPHQFASA